MARYTSDSRDRVREAVDMVALVGARVELRRAGVNSYFGRCPFHDERSGSFHVSPDEKLYHCFGCSESGDPFDFVMQTEGLDFKGALESLAERFAVTLQTEEEDPAAAAAAARRERLFALLGRAATYYERYLWEAKEAEPARDYLLERGFTEAALREFRVGFAPAGWDKLVSGSLSAGVPPEELLAVGLAQERRGRKGLIDRFRGRIMFPTADARGRIRGFGARAMTPEQQPKYLNTSDGELYHKREVLYGIQLARAAAAKAGRMILVEGYTDVMALHQAGVRNAVGIMGTSFTREQVGELVRVVGTLELCLDADPAGQEAIVRAAPLAQERGLELRVVPMPAGSDPGDLIRAEGADALRERVGRSVAFPVFETERILSLADTSSAEGRDKAVRRLAPVIGALGPSVLRDELVQKAASRLDLTAARLATLLESQGPGAGRPGADDRSAGAGSPGGGGAGGAGPGGDAGGVAGRNGNGSSSVGQAVPRPPRAELARSERAFLVLCTALPARATEILGGDVEELFTSDLARRAARHLSGQAERPLAGIPAGDDEMAHVIADLVARAGKAGRVNPDQLEHARLVLELSRLERAMRRTRSGEGGDMSALGREREEVRRAIKEVTARMEE